MKFSLLVAAFTLSSLAFGAATATNAKKQPPAHRSLAAGHGTTTRRKGRSRKSSGSRRGGARQLSPTADRYKEIQKALADRGYLKTEPNGVWDGASQNAMRAFQSDKKLDPSGKITAASLIGLGLGPKQDAAAVHPAAATAPAAAQPADPTPTSPVNRSADHQ